VSEEKLAWASPFTDEVKEEELVLNLPWQVPKNINIKHERGTRKTSG
jgi:hypothetical protein